MLHKIVYVCAALIGFEATLVMLGWVLHIDGLTRFTAGNINMKFATALVFFVNAFALVLLFRVTTQRSELGQIVLPGLALFAFLIMATLLASGIFGISTGIENLFAPETKLTVGTVAPGLPSVPTMANFILFGLACIIGLFPDINQPFYYKVIGGVIVVVGCIGIIGHIFKIAVLYYKFTESGTPMALNTAICFVLLGLALGLIGVSQRQNHEA